MQGFEISGLFRQHGAIQRRRFLQPALAMQREALCQSIVGNGHGGAVPAIAYTSRSGRKLERTTRRRERIGNVVTFDGSMETFIVHPEQDGPFAASVLSIDVWVIQGE